MLGETEKKSLEQAVTQGKLQASSLRNIYKLLNGTQDPVAPAAVNELINQQNWAELNNRFFKSLAFGTGGLRGRTIGATVTSAEQAHGGENGRPEFPCVGTACMNFFNVGRAMRGLINYVRKFRGAMREDCHGFGLRLRTLRWSLLNARSLLCHSRVEC